MAIKRFWDAKKGDQISKNYKLGDEIKTLEELMNIASEKKAVFYQPAGFYSPASRTIAKHKSLYSLYNKVKLGYYIKLEKI